MRRKIEEEERREKEEKDEDRLLLEYIKMYKDLLNGMMNVSS